jgi:uncharacterized membrane protein YqaE (UPF0057 family)
LDLAGGAVAVLSPANTHFSNLMPESQYQPAKLAHCPRSCSEAVPKTDTTKTLRQEVDSWKVSRSALALLPVSLLRHDSVQNSYRRKSLRNNPQYQLLSVFNFFVAFYSKPVMKTLRKAGVFLQVGIGKQFWINILLTILGYIPGIVHAVWVIAKYYLKVC